MKDAQVLNENKGWCVSSHECEKYTSLYVYCISYISLFVEPLCVSRHV